MYLLYKKISERGETTTAVVSPQSKGIVESFVKLSSAIMRRLMQRPDSQAIVNALRQ